MTEDEMTEVVKRHATPEMTSEIEYYRESAREERDAGEDSDPSFLGGFWRVWEEAEERGPEGELPYQRKTLTALKRIGIELGCYVPYARGTFETTGTGRMREVKPAFRLDKKPWQWERHPWDLLEEVS